MILSFCVHVTFACVGVCVCETVVLYSIIDNIMYNWAAFHLVVLHVVKRRVFMLA